MTANDLATNGHVVAAFKRAVEGCNIDQIPKLVVEVIKTGAWQQRVFNGHFYKHERFIDFIVAKPVAGCGLKPPRVEALLKMKGDEEALALWREATHETPGPKSHHNVMGIKRRQGNSKAYLLERLKRQRPDLFKQVIAEELSTHRAAVIAGFITKP
jgi:hypothetical protein